MTASLATGIIHDTATARRSQPAAHARSREWQTLYERQLAQQRPHDSSADTRDADAGASAAQSDTQQNDRSEPDSRVVVVAAGGHLQLKMVGRGGSAATPDPGCDPIEAGDAGLPSSGPPTIVPSPDVGIAAATALPQKAARPERTSGRGAPIPIAADARQPAATVLELAMLASGPESRQALATALATPDTWALPAAISVQAGGSPDSQQAARQPASSSELPIDAAAAGAIAAQRVAAAPNSGAGSARQRASGDPDREQTPGEAVSPESASGRHYGTFPLIVSGELLELEFVAVRTRSAASAAAAVRQIFVSVQPPGMERLELTAQNLGGRVTVSIGGQAANGGTAAALDVPALLQRLGWGAYPVTVVGEDR